MICCKERDKNNRFGKSCMQWTELAAIGYTATPQPTYFSFFSLIHIHYMERMNKTMLWGNLLFLLHKKEEILPNP